MIHNKAGWPNGKALDYESRDCRFDPCVGQFFAILEIYIVLIFPMERMEAVKVNFWSIRFGSGVEARFLRPQKSTPKLYFTLIHPQSVKTPASDHSIEIPVLHKCTSSVCDEHMTPKNAKRTQVLPDVQSTARKRGR